MSPNLPNLAHSLFQKNYEIPVFSHAGHTNAFSAEIAISKDTAFEKLLVSPISVTCIYENHILFDGNLVEQVATGHRYLLYPKIFGNFMEVALCNVFEVY